MATCSQALLVSDNAKRTAYVYGTLSAGASVVLGDGTSWTVDKVLNVLDETEVPRAFQIGW